MKTILDVIGRPIEVKKTDYVVTATDKVLSGWGRAEGKIHKQVVICSDYEQCKRVTRNLRLQGFTYINWRGAQIPRYSSSRYSVSYHHADDCPLWNK